MASEIAALETGIELGITTRIASGIADEITTKAKIILLINNILKQKEKP